MRFSFLSLCVVLLLLIFSPSSLSAQSDGADTLTPRSVDLGVSDAALIDLFMPEMPGFGGNSEEMLREQSVKPFLMPVRRQTFYEAGICQALADALEFYLNYEQNYKQNLSPDFILLNMEKSAVKDALTVLAEEGTVDATIVPYGSQRLPSAVNFVDKYRIVNFLELYRADSRNVQKIFATRKSLMRGNPVIVLLRVEDGVLPPVPGDVQPSDSYAFLVVGFDQQKQAFELRSTFGANWGRFGYAWVGYKDFSKIVEGGYVLLPE